MGRHYCSHGKIISITPSYRLCNSRSQKNNNNNNSNNSSTSNSNTTSTQTITTSTATTITSITNNTYQYTAKMKSSFVNLLSRIQATTTDSNNVTEEGGEEEEVDVDAEEKELQNEIDTEEEGEHESDHPNQSSSSPVNIINDQKKDSISSNSGIHRHPIQAEDVAKAIAWVRENIEQYGGDPDRLFLSGHSAGKSIFYYGYK